MEPLEIVISDYRPGAQTSGWETYQTDPVITSGLNNKSVQLYGSASISVDYDTKPGRPTFIEWFKDNNRIKYGEVSGGRGRTTIRVNQATQAHDGVYAVRVTDVHTKRNAVTQGQINVIW
ncbi:uncharacterized protein [Amphiura filiformis]|uniref:uncharacterized protein n=1 Tax=Amphiura filiformis TaxID=82378 RepID=UPI003B21BF5B